MELFGRAAFFETELRNRRGGETELDLRLRARHLLQYLTRPITDLLSTAAFDGRFVGFRRLVNTEHDDPADDELRRPRILLPEKPVERREPCGSVRAGELGQKILERSGHIGQSATEHVFRHSQSPL